MHCIQRRASLCSAVDVSFALQERSSHWRRWLKPFKPPSSRAGLAKSCWEDRVGIMNVVVCSTEFCKGLELVCMRHVKAYGIPL